MAQWGESWGWPSSLRLYSWLPGVGMEGIMPLSQPPAPNHSPHSWSLTWRLTRSPAWRKKAAFEASVAAWRMTRDQSDLRSFWASPK